MSAGCNCCAGVGAAPAREQGAGFAGVGGKRCCAVESAALLGRHLPAVLRPLVLQRMLLSDWRMPIMWCQYCQCGSKAKEEEKCAAACHLHPAGQHLHSQRRLLGHALRLALCLLHKQNGCIPHVTVLRILAVQIRCACPSTLRSNSTTFPFYTSGLPHVDQMNDAGECAVRLVSLTTACSHYRMESLAWISAPI